MNKEQDWERKNRVYDLRLKGRTFRQIAASEGIGVGTVHRWVQEVLDATVLPNVEAIRKQEIDRLMRYLERLDERIDDGDDRAISIALKISERLCKMLGADMPTQHVVEKVELTQVDLAIRDLISAQNAKNQERKDAAAALRAIEERATEGLSGSDDQTGDDVSDGGIEQIVMEN